MIYYKKYVHAAESLVLVLCKVLLHIVQEPIYLRSTSISAASETRETTMYLVLLLMNSRATTRDTSLFLLFWMQQTWIDLRYIGSLNDMEKRFAQHQPLSCVKVVIQDVIGLPSAGLQVFPYSWAVIDE